MRLRIAIGAGLVLSLAVAAADKTQPLHVKLGLWQMTYTTNRSTAPVQTIRPELLAKMTPEQRARVEAKLKARAAAGPRTETRQFCLTEDKLKNAVFSSEESTSCRRKMLASTSKVQQFHEECLDGGMKRIIEGRFEAPLPDLMKGSLQIKAAGSDAAGVSMKMDIVGKWVASTCSSIAQ